jgi:hypothetical protein
MINSYNNFGWASWHTSNHLSYLRGKDQEDHTLRSAQAKS